MNRKSENHYTFGPRYVGFFPSSFLQMTDGCSPVYDLVYLPQMCSINTEAMNRRLITSTGTGPLGMRREGGLTSVSRQAYY